MRHDVTKLTDRELEDMIAAVQLAIAKEEPRTLALTRRAGPGEADRLPDRPLASGPKIRAATPCRTSVHKAL
jgi:hypothetical protein